MAAATAEYESPATLVAILICAHRAGDRDLERIAKTRLEHMHGMRIVFVREPKCQPEDA